VLAAPLLSYVLHQYSWRAAFVLLGVLGSAWVLAWAIWGAEGAQGESAAEPVKSTDAERVPYARLIFDRTVLGTILATFAAYWILAMGLTWLPPYLQKGLGYNVLQAGWLVAVIVGSNIPLQLGGSWLSERLLRRGVSSRIARGHVMNGLIVAGGASILLAMTDGVGLTGKIVLLAIGCALPNIAFCIGPAIIGEVTPSSQRGALLAINSSIATVAGLIAPWVTGWLVQRGSTPATGYGNGYLLAGALLVCGGIVAALLVDPERTRARAQRRSDDARRFGNATRAHS
jgi:MFS family permease